MLYQQQMAKLRDQIVASHQLIADQLTSSGWRRRVPDIFTIDLGSEVLGWIGLNRATHKTGGILLINPVVGVRNQKLEQLVAQFSGTRFHLYNPPTIAGNVGYLMPEDDFLQWAFSSEHDAEALVSELVQTIQDYGMPFIRANVDLEQLIDTMLHARFGFPHQLKYRIPVAYMMLGRTIEARSEIDKNLAEYADAQYQAAVGYRNFAAALQKAIDDIDRRI